MNYECNMRFNTAKLLDAHEDLKKKFPPAIYNEIKDGNRYGWAFTSLEGDIDDIHGRRYNKYGKEADCFVKTPAYCGYFKELLEEMEGILGKVCRARIIGIDGYREIALHHDGHDGSRFWRYHIPIVPNAKCTFSADGIDFIMAEAGRLYRFPAWVMHSVVNHEGPRVHLMFSAFRDIKEISSQKDRSRND